MHNDIHWRAIDPLDVGPDEWLVDVERYSTWSCSLGIERAPTEPEAASRFRREIDDLQTVEACEALGRGD